MKKRLLSFLMAICMAAALLPAAAGADWEVAPRGLYVSIEAPVEGQKPASTGTSDFAAGTQSTVTSVVWSGELDANGCFKAGVVYTVTVTERINADLAGVFCMQGDNPQINYKKATFVSLSADKMEATASYTFPALQSNAEKAAEEAARAERDAQMHAEHVAQKEAERDAYKREFYTRAQADAAWWKLNGQELILDTSVASPDGYYSKLDADQLSRITRLLLNYPNPDPGYLTAEWPSDYKYCLHNIQEVWLGPSVDAKKFLDDLAVEAAKSSEGVYKRHSSGILNGMLTIYVPETQMPNGLLSYRSSPMEPTYSVKVYAGDVYEAYKQGDSAGRDWCPGHEYTGRVETASRMMQNNTCQKPNLWYYSCKWCGKCEYNANHTFSRSTDGKDTSNRVFPSHQFQAYNLSDKNYIGTNERGEKIYCSSCIWCGISYRDAMTDQKASWAVGGDMYTEAMKSTVDLYRWPAFAVPGGRDVTATVSAWAQDGVNWAAQNGLIDAGLLGGNYTGNITRLQFCSVAVRMAEKMTGKSITPAPSGTFSDTDSEYVRKAYAAGITSGTGGGTFNPNGTLTRQEMAAFLYRALMYVKNNSDIRYTIYDSRLESYSDNARLASWARDPMAFMNALGLIAGTTGTTLSPTANCTIEQALVVANRSLSADMIGWYQSLGGTEKNAAGGGTGGSNTRRCFYNIPEADIGAAGTFNQLRYSQSERFWVTGAAQTQDWVTRGERAQGDYIRILSIIDPYTGDTLYVQANDFRPIKAD